MSDGKVRYKWIDGGIEFVDAIPKNPSVSTVVAFVPLPSGLIHVLLLLFRAL